MKVNDLKDIHKGKTCFIIGAGPTARHINPYDLKDHIVIAVNSSVKKFRNCDYFLTDDWDVINWDYYDLVKTLDCTKLLYRKFFAKYKPHFREEKLVLYSHREYMVNGVVVPNNLKLTKSEPIVGARTGIASAIHFGHIMGCDRIVLAGCDCCYEDGKRYLWEFPGEERCARKDFKRYLCPTDSQGKDAHCNDFIKYWEFFNHINSDINICNIKGTGKLEVFNEVLLEDVLR